MKTHRTTTLLLSSLALFVFALLACQKGVADVNAIPNVTSSPSSAQALKIYLTDHQTPVFDSVFIDIRKLDVKMEDDTLSNGGWVSLSIHPGVYDILRFRNGLDTMFAAGSLPNNRIQKVRLTLGALNSVMRNGQSFPLTIKDNDKEVVINLTPANFDINSGQVFFWLDFDAGSSIKANNSGQGNNNGYELKPQIKAFGKNNTGRIEGTVLPTAANPVVKAVRGADTATALPEHDGEFKIMGLTAGTYTVIVEGSNGYLDTTITNARVVNKEDTKLPAITLHK